MPVPFPTDDQVRLTRPDLEESIVNAAGVLSATRPVTGNTEFQRILMAATWESMTGHRIDPAKVPDIDARGFAFPGAPGSAPPLLAQHDWVHVLAGYGTKVEAELEVFAFIARANDNPRGFSLLAMVVSLFETGYLTQGAGLFEAFPGQLSREGMSQRIGDAMRRGALSRGLGGAPDVDFMQVDWFTLATEPIEAVEERFHIVAKSPGALSAGSVTPWEPGGISEAQVAMGERLATELGRPYDSLGATP